MQRPPYRAKLWPNGRLAGLITRDDEDEKRLVPFAFAEVHLPNVTTGRTPRLTSRPPESRWVFQWDGRRRTGYLLVAPSSREGQDLRFRVAWEEPPQRQDVRSTASHLLRVTNKGLTALILREVSNADRRSTVFACPQ